MLVPFKAVFGDTVAVGEKFQMLTNPDAAFPENTLYPALIAPASPPRRRASAKSLRTPSL
jgi:hypothetical protein